MSHKKPRLEESMETEAFMDVPPPSLITSLMQQTKNSFESELVDLETKDLIALEDKVHQLGLWIKERKLQLQREARLRYKEEQEQRLQAIYDQDEPQSCTSNQPLFTTESATVLLDSGFLSFKEIGKLCLLTGKFLLGHLELDYNFVWKKIFEAKFDPKAEQGLSSLCHSHKFNQILDKKAGSGHSVISLQGTHTIAAGGRRTKVETRSSPSRGEYHAEILDNEVDIGELMTGNDKENNYLKTISGNKTAKQIQQMLHHPPGEGCARVSTLALRMDTWECTTIHERNILEEDEEVGQFFMRTYVCPNPAGQELLQNVLSDKGKPDVGDPYLQVQICVYYGSGGGDDDGESNEEVPVLEVRFGADDEIDNVYGMNLYRCLDYGIEW
eukprot:CAMPEP_0168764186 /NCGR_PEP_ID=MMETSP0724-20121128/24746_1 /TAXON_ID=265536 /ORGANISM="Amphiprora sp., Strain CCMP467" /LENGTH=384 /DNA_ID=CAMNT_0008813407 /DNA_START=71 /DNA_END=1223 /DNA_ORIENTATION=+